MDSVVTLQDQILCTCVGASITSICTTPLDVIKVRLQAMQKHSRTIQTNSPVICNCSRLFSNSFCLRHEHTVSHAYRTGVFLKNSCASHSVPSASSLITTLVKNEGLRSLWSGLSPTLLMSVPGTMIYFTAYDQIKHRFGYHQPDSKKLYIPVLAGTMARVAAVIAVSPLELLRTKMQSAKISYLHLFRGVQLSVRSNGVSFLFRGLGPSLLRDVPFSAIYWLSYESLKVYRQPCTNAGSSGFFSYFVSGAISGMLAAIVTCPFDVIKTHRQIELGEVTSKHRISSSTWSLLRNLYRSKGLPGLYAGIGPRITKVAPSCAIMISTYEVGKNVIHEWRKASKVSVQ